MATQVKLLVGTRKGAFIYTSPLTPNFSSR